MFERKDSNKLLPGVHPGNSDTLHNTKRDLEIQKIIHKHLQITLLMIDAKYAYLNQQALQRIKELFEPIKKSQDDIIKQLLESNLSLALKNTITPSKCGENFIQHEGEQEKILKIC